MKPDQTVDGWDRERYRKGKTRRTRRHGVGGKMRARLKRRMDLLRAKGWSIVDVLRSGPGAIGS